MMQNYMLMVTNLVCMKPSASENEIRFYASMGNKHSGLATSYQAMSQ